LIFDDADLHAPRLGLLVDDLLQSLVEPLSLGQQHVELGLAQDRAQRRLRDLGGGLEEALDLHDRVPGIDDLEVGDGRHARGHVVSRDDVLGRDGERDGAQVDADQLVNNQDEQDQSRGPSRP
jgi:hypothetical protein